MATLLFDGTAHTLTLVDSTGSAVGQWPANNIVDHRATLRFVPNGTYRIVDPSHPHRHNNGDDTVNGAYGRFGIIRLQPFTADGVVHSGVGVHAGRANTHAQNHPTMGCIRTTDAAMAAIVAHMATDALTTITVQNNHVQSNATPAFKGDGHGDAGNLGGRSAPVTMLA